MIAAGIQLLRVWNKSNIVGSVICKAFNVIKLPNISQSVELVKTPGGAVNHSDCEYEERRTYIVTYVTSCRF